jgi:hypothetical protein
LRFLALLDIVRLKLINLALLLEIKDGNGGGGSSAEPVSVGRKDKSVDLVTGLKRVEMLRLVEIPEHGGTVLTTRCAEGAIGRDGDSVDVTSVADVIGLNTAGSKFPNL